MTGFIDYEELESHASCNISVSKIARLVSSALGLMLVFGCGDDTGLEKRYPVYGTVTFKGEPLDHGTINFMPVKVDVGRAASAAITNGKYSLTTASEGDGALPGAYNVTVSSLEVSDNAELKKISGGGQFHHEPSFAKATKNAKSLVPAKYCSLANSGLKADVKTESNKFDFDLTD